MLGFNMVYKVLKIGLWKQIVVLLMEEQNICTLKLGGGLTGESRLRLCINIRIGQPGPLNRLKRGRRGLNKLVKKPEDSK